MEIERAANVQYKYAVILPVALFTRNLLELKRDSQAKLLLPFSNFKLRLP